MENLTQTQQLEQLEEQLAERRESLKNLGNDVKSLYKELRLSGQRGWNMTQMGDKFNFANNSTKVKTGWITKQEAVDFLVEQLDAVKK